MSLVIRKLFAYAKTKVHIELPLLLLHRWYNPTASYTARFVSNLVKKPKDRFSYESFGES